jgi:hypothetical protein
MTVHGKYLLIILNAHKDLFDFLIAFDTWSDQFNLQSKVIPSTFMDFLEIICSLWMLMVIVLESFRWNIQSSVLLSFTLRPESFNHLTIISSFISRSAMRALICELNSMMKLSSAKLVKFVRSKRGDTKIAYKMGPRTNPWMVPSFDS